MPLDAQHGWQRDDMVTAEEILAVAAHPLRPHPRGRRPRPRLRPRRALAGGRRPGPGRRDRLGHPPVLPRLRPHPADRRRPGPQLPVRPRGVRPARRPALRARPTSEIAGLWRVAMWGKKAGSGLDDPAFLQPRPPDVRDRRLTGRQDPCDADRTPTRRAPRRPSGSRAPRGTATGARGAPRTPARSCAGRRCAASGCSRPVPRRRPPGSPWRNRSASRPRRTPCTRPYRRHR